MSNNKSVLVTLTLPILAFAVTVQAEEGIHGSVTVGAASVQLNNPSLEFGRFTGVTDDSVHIIGASDIQSKNGSNYWRLTAEDVGLNNRRFNLNGGNSGSHKFSFGYEELDTLTSINSKTPFDGSGSNTLTLPGGFVKSATTSGMTNLAASLKNIDLATKRKEGEAKASVELNQNFDLSLSFKRQIKDGTKSTGAALGPGSYVRAFNIPEPVDYQTDDFSAGLAWHNERGQAKAEYVLSRFSNANPTLTWDAPFVKPAMPAGAAYPASGLSSLPPDNQAQRFSLSGNYKLADTTRVSALFERGYMTQDMALQNYTTNPASVITVPVPRSSADTRIDTTLFKLDLAAQPLSRLSLHAGFRHFDTVNKSPRDLYQIVIHDTGNQVANTTSRATYNRPYDYTQNQVNFDGSYHFGHGTTLKLGYDHNEMDYSYRAVKGTTENTYSGKLSKRWDSGTTLSFNLSEGRKRSDGGYNETWVFEAMHSAAYLETQAPNVYFDKLPGMQQYDIADRNRSRQEIGLTLPVQQSLTLGINASRSKDDFNAAQFGLQERENENFTLDATLTPDQLTNVSLYFTRQETDTRQASRAYNAQVAPPPKTKAEGSAAASNDWISRLHDVINTIGLDASRSFMDEKLLVRLSYAYSRANTDINFLSQANVFTTPLPADMPTVTGRQQTIDLSGTYKVQKNLSVQLGALIDLYRTTDWATDTIPPGSTASPSLLTLSGTPAPYRALVLHTSMNYRF